MGLKVKRHTLGIALFALTIVTGGFVGKDGKKEIKATIAAKKGIQRDLVLLNNQNGILPFKNLASKTIASINADSDISGEFRNMLANYAPLKNFNLAALAKSDLKPFSTLILKVSASSLYKPEVVNFIREYQATKELIIAGFGEVTALQQLDEFNTPIVWNPVQSAVASEYSAQVIFGGESAVGKLAFSVSPKYKEGEGFATEKTRLKYTSPEELGINSSKFNKIDDIMREAIASHATPGAVVMVVKDGNVVFNKAYGSHTYGSDETTKTADVFDLASVTKVASTTMAAMKLYDEHKLSLNAGIGNYLDDLKGTNKYDIPVRDVLLHQAGFINLDFFSYVRPQDHSSDSSAMFPVKLADNYYLRRGYYQDVMLPKMVRTPLPTRGQYVYSDISMYMMKEIIEHQAGTSLDKYVASKFYGPLGMKTAGYNPLQRIQKTQIVPTERDTYFRKTLLQGYVHDSGASLANGVSGHAGLFASANDLAILNQMLLNGGTYGGEEYFKPETVNLFTSRQSNVSRRGLGFDKGTGLGYPSRYASSQTYGHTGYTGTCVWVDPKQKLIYIFLSNRVYPSASDKLNSMRIRPRIQDVVYEAIAESRRSLASASED